MRRSGDSSSGGSTFFAKSLSPYYPRRLDDSVLKVGVELNPDLTPLAGIDLKDKLPQLLQVNQHEPLETVTKDLCSRWELNNPHDFALQFTQRSTHYISERNRFDLMNGDVLLLTLSPEKLSDILISWLLSPNVDDIVCALPYLVVRVSDPQFATTFIANNGLGIVMNILEKGILNDLPLSQMLSCFHGLLGWTEENWDLPSSDLLVLIADFVVGRAKLEHPKVLSVAMTILEDIITNSSSRAPLVNKQVPFESLVRHLESSDLNVQHSVLALMNAMFSKALLPARMQIATVLFAKPVRNALINNILRNNVGPGLAHQLHVLQQLMLNVYEVKARSKVQLGTPSVEEFNEFCRNVGEKLGPTISPTVSRKGNLSLSRDLNKLGFRTKSNPIEDFDVVPPGQLALDCILYFYRCHHDVCFKIILENAHRTDGRECPFIQCCIELVSVLLDALHIGELPSEQGQVYYELLFTEEHPFDELFCRCVSLVNRTWKEMRASSLDDIGKVMAVVKEQICRSLAERPRNFHDLEEGMKRYNYAEISESWERERSLKEESHFQTPQIFFSKSLKCVRKGLCGCRELKEHMKPRIFALVARNRLSCMKKGQIFAKYCRGSKGNREKVPICEISHVIMGSNCTHIKETKGKKSGDVFAFTLVLVGDKAMKNSYNFVAPDAETFDLWTDGLMTLLGNEMVSPHFKQESELWLNMELRLRLLELESIEVPATALPVPDPPENFEFGD
ncbi:engulfment and cell motility protein 1 [Trichuris trichiura]|uniref:Engulfment and cell motility protein 1 n=1 Tax=Trichuris trichiura TaxID=36087 RepID=A0A077Z5L2_TRITR|nr:engulfment and cell motility protein 1 [Trichuris trichiura]